MSVWWCRQHPRQSLEYMTLIDTPDCDQTLACPRCVRNSFHSSLYTALLALQMNGVIKDVARMICKLVTPSIVPNRVLYLPSNEQFICIQKCQRKERAGAYSTLKSIGEKQGPNWYRLYGKHYVFKYDGDEVPMIVNGIGWSESLVLVRVNGKMRSTVAKVINL